MSMKPLFDRKGGNETRLVDKVIGNAYGVVRLVAEHLEEIKKTVTNMGVISQAPESAHTATKAKEKAEEARDTALLASEHSSNILQANQNIATRVESVGNRILGSFPEAPTYRNDGSPLEVGDSYFNTTLNLTQTYDGSTWNTPNADGQAILGDLASSDEGKGAELVGFKQSVPGAVPKTQAQFNAQYPSLWDFLTDEEIADSQTGNPELDTSAAWNALFSGIRDCEVLIPPGFYKASNIRLYRKGDAPNAGGYTIRAKGAVIVGEGEFVIDSCKRVTILGIDAPSTSLKFRGCWYSTFDDTRFHELVVGDQPGTNFQSNYWNNWYGGQYQRIVTHENLQSGFNATNFYGTAFRGTAGQGFTKVCPHMLEFRADQDVQNLNFFGGDISYYSGGIYFIEEPINEDISITFDSVYLDSEGIPPIDGPKRSIRVRNCHVAGKINIGGSLKGALRGSQTVWGNEHTAGWQSYAALNLIPNGDLSQPNVDITTQNGPVGVPGGATVTWQSDTTGPYLNISQPGTGANQVLFRSVALPFTGVYSTAIIVRKSDPGTVKLDIGLFGQFGQFEVGEEWTLITISSNDEIPGGATRDVLIRGNSGVSFNVDVKYIGLVAGTHPPMIVPQHPLAARYRDLITNKITLGSAGSPSGRPIVTAGAGSPAGVVSAYMGSLYGQVDATPASVLWAKTAGGGGSGGWVRVALTQGVYTSGRPTPQAGEVGYCVFDRDLQKPIWWNGTVWKDATGATV